MREFFKAELKRLHITTGLQQYFKMSDRPEEITMLLDELVIQCEKFPSIPDEDKKKLIQEFMITDAEFIGFNKKILYKWFNLVNKNYIVNQSQFQEDENHEPASPEIADKYLQEWSEALSKMDDRITSTEGIKNLQVKRMQEQYSKFECKHTGEFIVDEKGRICCDCGKEL